MASWLLEAEPFDTRLLHQYVSSMLLSGPSLVFSLLLEKLSAVSSAHAGRSPVLAKAIALYSFLPAGQLHDIILVRCAGV